MLFIHDHVATVQPAVSSRHRAKQSVGLVVAVAILAVRGLPNRSAKPNGKIDKPTTSGPGQNGRGFSLLLTIAMIDSATRMGFLTFLPFLLKIKGADLPMIGFALTLVFTGGAAGKLICGWLGVVRDLRYRRADRGRDPAAAAAAVDGGTRGVAADRGGA